jgi:hypothetical protein
MPRNPHKIDYSGRFPQGFEVFASNHSILRRMALNAHNRMPKREVRAALDPAYLELLLSLV